MLTFPTLHTLHTHAHTHTACWPPSVRSSSFACDCASSVWIFFACHPIFHSTRHPPPQPANKKHGNISDEERHVGDLGNVQSDAEGVIKLNITDNLISLFGKNSILGR